MKDRNYLTNTYNATSTDDGKGDIETYESWLERQLLSRIEKLESLQSKGKTKEEVEQLIYDHLTNLPWDGGYPANWQETLAEHLANSMQSHANQDGCIFFTSNKTSSATICDNCGKEKYEHNKPQI